MSSVAASAAVGGEMFLAADGGARLAVVVRGGTSSGAVSVAVGGEVFLAADGGERLVVAAGGGTSSVSVGGEARMTAGGFIGTSGAAGEPLAVGRGDEAPEPAGLLHHRLRPLQ
jgi:hypothetical protein